MTDHNVSTRFTLKLATSADTPAVDELRLLAYSGATYFKLNDVHQLFVGTDPVDSFLLCAWEGTSLVATLRLATVRTLEGAEDLLGLKAPRPVDLPAAIFSRGAVHPSQQGQGWMPYLLTEGILLAQQLGYRCALGAQASGTPHQGAMVRAGWQVQDVGRMTHAALDMKSTAQYLWLDNVDFPTAIEHGMTAAQNLTRQCDTRALRLPVGEQFALAV